MRVAIFNWLRELRATYWFIPSLMALLAMGLSFGAIALDTWLGDRWLADIPGLYLNQPDGARAVLSTIAGSMITVAGVTFSMTILTVSFAAGQMGPRLLSNFMRDRGNQVTLGMFIAAFIYCLLVLRVVRSPNEGATVLQSDSFVPHISIMLALVLALASVAVLIYFIHHVPESINVSQVIAKLGRQLDEMVEEQFPEKLGQSSTEDSSVEGGTEPAVLADDARPVLCDESGYIRALDEAELMRVSKRHDLTVRLEYRPGDFVSRGKPLLYAWPQESVTEAAADDLRTSFTVGAERTMHQNMYFLVDELVEIAARALSPGVNDPFTAMGCLDWLQSVLLTLAGREVPGSHRFDEEGHLRVIVHPIGFKAMAGRVFDQLLPYVSSDRNAALHTMQTIGEVAVEQPAGSKREVMLVHASRLRAAAMDNLQLAVDRDAVDQRYQELLTLTINASARQKFRDGQGWLGGSA